MNKKVGKVVFLILSYSSTIKAAHAGFKVENVQFGIKSGYQIYDNGYSSPTSFGWGGYVNIDINNPWSFEGGVLFLGEAKEVNHNVGAFNSAELSALYNFNLTHENDWFLKGGIAPWFGYMTVPNGEQRYEYGMSPLFGIGYQTHIYNSFYGRLEYQYIHNLGGDSIGYTNSHFLTLGLSWRKQKSFLVKEDVINTNVGRPTSTLRDENMSDMPPSLITRSIYGSFLFDTNSSILKLPKPFNSLDAARQLIKQGCQLFNIKAEGYSDGSGHYEYNRWLSERRVRNVANYITHALGSQEKPIILWHGSDRFIENSSNNISFYERRVDVEFEFRCLNNE
ncbi:outer membrane beta-barrel protein [Vibrio rotiferianus]|uniref:outer membrane beta-barrel protein n=1 Tax=Vibrio rotiferianus TaxID=190895 RepID=UPI00406A3046